MNKGYLAVKLATLNEFEKSIFENMVFPDSIVIVEKTDCMIFNGSTAVLYNLLYDFSTHFDVELI